MAEQSNDAPLPGAELPPERMSYRIREAAQLLGVPEKTVRWLIREGELGHRMAGRYYLVPHAEIERFLKRGTSNDARTLRAV